MRVSNQWLFSLLAVAAAGLAACSTIDDDAVADDAQLERGVVKTEFAISYPVRATNQTRMTAAAVQWSESQFRGITGIKLYPFTVAETAVDGSTSLPTPVTLTGQASTGKSGASSDSDNQIDKNSVLYTTNNSHLYKDVVIPIGTQTFMFYGKALNDVTPEYTNFQEGVLDETGTDGGSGTLAGIKFSPTAIVSNGDVTDAGKAVATYLTNIANVTGWSASDVVALQSLYHDFIKMHAGSYTSVKAAVQQLYTSIYSRTDAVSVAIKAAIAGGDNKIGSAAVTANNGTLTFPTLTGGGYPADKGLPDGAACLQWTDGEFKMVTTADNTGLDIAPLTNYVYPAQLYYRGISSIVVANTTKEEVYKDGTAWSKILEGYGYSESNTETGSVAYNTRSIAIVDPVQYAVGRLDVKIKANETPLGDNTTGTNQNKFDVGEGSTLFKLTGVLVGGQKAVDYKFQPISTETNVYTIYDKTMNAVNYLTTTETTDANANHTLVLETKVDAEVKIALEFEYSATADNPKPIEATGGLILPGTKFYLVGTLKPTGVNEGKNTFEQDHYTVATINVKSLKNAYNYLPDLRAPQLELGLSVDLTWQDGYTQTVNIE